MREYKTIICVFAGRERYMKILNEYIDLGLKLKIIDEYHLMNFTFNKNDNEYIINLQKEMNEKYEGRVFIHYTDENIKLIEENEKKKIINKNQHIQFNNTQNKWINFYSILGDKIGDEKSVIIKCDDDILFIDIYSLEKAFYQRWINKYPFIMHSNCINNGVCTYFQKNKLEKIKELINKYPKGGICGPIFERPELSLVIHYDFLNKILESEENIINNIKYFYLDKNEFISTRISINFVLMHGEDIPYIKQIGENDEYELSSKMPEKLLRPNLILKDMITSHFSYGMQDKILKQRPDIIELYGKLCKIYINKMEKINEKKIMEDVIIKNNYICKKINENRLYIRNPILNNQYLIKDKKSDKYLYFDIENNKIKLEKDLYTYFDITNIKDKLVYITLGLHPLTRYNVPNDILNDILYMKGLIDNRDKLIEMKIVENLDDREFYTICLIKSKLYLIIEKGELKFKNIKEDEIKENIWEIINGKRTNNYKEYIEVERVYIEKKDTFIYKNIENGEIYYNTYSGWRLETLFFEEELKDEIKDEVLVKLKENENQNENEVLKENENENEILKENENENEVLKENEVLIKLKDNELKVEKTRKRKIKSKSKKED